MFIYSAKSGCFESLLFVTVIPEKKESLKYLTTAINKRNKHGEDSIKVAMWSMRWVKKTDHMSRTCARVSSRNIGRQNATFSIAMTRQTALLRQLS